MPYRQNVHHCRADAVGGRGLSATEYDALLRETQAALAAVRREVAAGALPALAIANASDDWPTIERTAADLARRFDHLVVLATGGSSLGARSLATLAADPLGQPRSGPRLHFIDNLDPDTVGGVLAALERARVGFLLISKSGGTMEVLAPALVCLDWVATRHGKAAVPERFLAITEPGDNPLRRIAARSGFPVLDHDPRIGGRFSVLSIVGLLTTAAIGLSARAVRAGAAAVLDQACQASDLETVAPAVGAAIAVGLARHRGILTDVLMPYSNKLIPFASWYCQLWAESLGKQGRGLTPVRAFGPLDQHSQLQLYLDGPSDKFFTLLVRDVGGRGGRIALDGLDDPRIAYLGGRTLGDVVAAAQRSTAETLAASGRPIRVIELSDVDELTMGAIFMHFMLETVIAAKLLGVDPFDQPAVEDGKTRARAYLNEGR